MFSFYRHLKLMILFENRKIRKKAQGTKQLLNGCLKTLWRMQCGMNRILHQLTVGMIKSRSQSNPSTTFFLFSFCLQIQFTWPLGILITWWIHTFSNSSRFKQKKSLSVWEEKNLVVKQRVNELTSSFTRTVKRRRSKCFNSDAPNPDRWFPRLAYHHLRPRGLVKYKV